MVAMNSRLAAALFGLGLLAVSGMACVEVRAQTPAVDPAATQILKRMGDYLSGLKQFSVHTHNNWEDLLDSGQRVDLMMSASVVVSRPNLLRAERKGDIVSQAFYYDGKTLTLYSPDDKVYATEPAPPTIEGMLDFARDTLGLLIPVGDLLYRDVYALLMQDVTSAVVVGKSVIGGVQCDHVAFSRPGVDFQVCVADSGPPLPRMYAVTDTGTPALLSVTAVMSDWNTSPNVADERFAFVPPQGAQPITFMRLDTAGAATR